MKITAVDTFLVDVPLLKPVSPYQSRYISSSTTGALLIRIETDAGITGWGETPQRLSFQNATSFTGVEANYFRPILLGKDPTDISALYADWGMEEPYLQSLVEMACWDILGKQSGQPLHRLLGGLYREEVEVTCCMGIRGPEEAAAISKHYVDLGFSTLKTKAGRSPEEDLAMVRAIRESVGDKLNLRIDPNMGYTPEVALQLARDLEPYELQYFEQPMHKDLLQESADIRQQTRTPLALNESVTTMEHVRKILELNAADYLLPDTYQCGGIWAVKLVGEVAASAKVPCIFHCSHDLGLRTATMLHMAASSPNFPLANDCTYYSLENDIITERFEINVGRIKVPKKPGLGVDIDEAMLKRYLVKGSV
ncbi:mandelate racemase/muconate lactonizing enzyme family protein [Gimesia aquarii]|uniref:L-Ala-D/L-Glu epimerase n=1 Tax=Gimesia aquarii TaxID=2527964 RepID=A0A517W2M2_9PLAN|nr:mandelate racemase/muconate lactonizing enzyme family protein [Gimesia aquarii]QDT99480.1 L-Ala-D/L-Glu epimerase [Gimesia aquarii]